MTVSRVVNNNGRVSSPTRERVAWAINKLNYRPNQAAQALSSGRSRTIGVVISEGAVEGPTSTLAGIEQGARDLGYTVTVSILQRPTPDSIASAVSDLQARAVAGIVLSAPHTGLDDSLIPPSPVPLVAVEGLSGRTPVVSVDQEEGARLATDHLLDLGHCVIAHVAGPKDRLEAVEREAGWRAAVRERGLRPGPLLRGDWSPRSGYQLGRRLLRRDDTTAVFVANDQMAIGLLRVLHEEHIHVPGRFSVVGFDDLPEASYLTPSLTTVHYDFYNLGRQTLRRLLADMHAVDGARPEPNRILMRPRLVVRESSGSVPGAVVASPVHRPPGGDWTSDPREGRVGTLQT
jgi:DNA-binding LacI/PurR family transcriptional regulator